MYRMHKILFSKYSKFASIFIDYNILTVFRNSLTEYYFTSLRSWFVSLLVEYSFAEAIKSCTRSGRIQLTANSQQAFFKHSNSKFSAAFNSPTKQKQKNIKINTSLDSKKKWLQWIGTIPMIGKNGSGSILLRYLLKHVCVKRCAHAPFSLITFYWVNWKKLTDFTQRKTFRYLQTCSLLNGFNNAYARLWSCRIIPR